MLGNKKSIPLWRRRRANFLDLERAINAIGGDGHHSDLQYAVVSQRTERQRVAVAKRRFIRPADLR